jgi:hypothetical protein
VVEIIVAVLPATTQPPHKLTDTERRYRTKPQLAKGEHDRYYQINLEELGGYILRVFDGAFSTLANWWCGMDLGADDLCNWGWYLPR